MSVLACDEEEAIIEGPPTATDFLTGDSQKSWYLAVQTPEGDFPFCKPPSPQAKDDIYTFYADGTFIYEHGEVTEDPSCTENCCTDGISIVGTWKFTDNEEKLEIYASHMKGEPAYTIDHLYIDGNVELTENKLILSQQSFSLEFLPRQ